jgi:hypothetical protein
MRGYPKGGGFGRGLAMIINKSPPWTPERERETKRKNYCCIHMSVPLIPSTTHTQKKRKENILNLIGLLPIHL